MPHTKPKASEIAAEAKKTFIPYIRQNFTNQWPATSFLCHATSLVCQPALEQRHCRFAFFEKDPVDVAIEWATGESFSVPVILAANEKRPGGDWEAGVMSPEECLCRRSNLFATLTTPAVGNYLPSNYPIPTRAGIYSESVVVFRSGPDKYDVWQEYKSLPIISVCPVKRPKIDALTKKYSFKQERELMRDKIRTALRIAVYYGYANLCISSFGLGPGFRNPAEEVALLWREAFLTDPEFIGHFSDVVFAFDTYESAPSPSSSKGKPPKSTSGLSADLDVFRHIFKPAVIHNAFQNPPGKEAQ